MSTDADDLYLGPELDAEQLAEVNALLQAAGKVAARAIDDADVVRVIGATAGAEIRVSCELKTGVCRVFVRFPPKMPDFEQLQALAPSALMAKRS